MPSNAVDLQDVRFCIICHQTLNKIWMSEAKVLWAVLNSLSSKGDNVPIAIYICLLIQYLFISPCGISFLSAVVSKNGSTCIWDKMDIIK